MAMQGWQCRDCSQIHYESIFIIYFSIYLGCFNIFVTDVLNSVKRCCKISLIPYMLATKACFAVGLVAGIL